MNHLFFLGCIPTRLLLTYLGYLSNHSEIYKHNKQLSISLWSITFIIGIGFWTIYTMGWRKTGIEAGGEIWWNSLRPIHGTNYLLFSILSLKGYRNAWWLLLMDTIIGVIAELVHNKNKK